MGEEGIAFTFALDEYQVPRHGKENGVLGGTMTKADKDKGGLFASVHRQADAAPGPEKYHKDILERSFVDHLKGGKFSNVGRDWRNGKSTVPSVGTYKTDLAFEKIQKRARGGKISNGDRKCWMTEDAENNKDSPAPGKYDPMKKEKHLHSPVFNSPRTESRVPKKQSAMGPGYYNPIHSAYEKRVLVYSGTKEDAKTFIDKIFSKKEKDKTPAPGHVGIPSSHWEDRAGKALHSARLLLDRHVVPRVRGIDSAR